MIIEERAKAYAGNKRRQLTTGQVVGFHVEDLEDILCQAYLQGAKDANGWVRCEDRLPEDDQQVYCRLTNGMYETLVWNEKYQIWEEQFGYDFAYDKENVLAWLPLPEFNPVKE
ncbi:MAG: DUF551 domain-containing protein [Muribaculaceae bacterium]